MKNYKLISVILLYLIGNSVFSQEDTTFWNAKMREIAEGNSAKGWVKIKEEHNLKADKFFSKNKDAFRLKKDDKMDLFGTKTDDIGFTHHKYQQTYKGIKVEGCEYILHEQNGKIITANGKLATDLNINSNPTISKYIALKNALKEINAQQYMWEDTMEERRVKELKEDQNASYYPNTELLITCVSPEFNLIPNNFLLVYKLIIRTKKPDRMTYWVYVNAHTGGIIKKINSNRNSNCHTGTFVPSYSRYGASRSFTTKKRKLLKLWKYTLEDECRGGGITTLTEGNELTDADNNWGLSSERPSTTTHWAMEMTYDYYKSTHLRKSFDDKDKKIISDTKLLIGGSAFNARFLYDDEQFEFGKANGDDGYNTLDVVGHEFTHGVIKFEANFEPTGEPATLAESFGDIFGEMVELNTLGTCDFIHRAEITNAGTPRNLMNPKASNHPNTYNGTFWNNVGNHDKGGVQNYWFYLLSRGGSGHIDDNPNNAAYNVSGIGEYKAAKIAYNNLAYYLNPTSDFSDAKNGSIFAAMGLYGSCSEEVKQTIKAWDAVGVTSTLGFAYDKTAFCIDFGVSFEQAIHNITSNCPIKNNITTTYIAGNKISLTQGFRSGSGSGAKIHFRAYLAPCLAAANKTDASDYYSDGNLNDEIEKYEEDDTTLITINPAHNAAIASGENPRNDRADEAITFKIYPNPSNGTFIIENGQWTMDNSKPLSIINYQLSIKNILGQVIYKSEIKSAHQQIDLSAHPIGIYILHLQTENEIITRKIVKE